MADFGSQVKDEKMKIVKAVYGSKLGKKISKEILLPILEALEQDYEEILDRVGDMFYDGLMDYLAGSSPGGHYEIILYDKSKPRGERLQFLADYYSSAPGGPPNTFAQDMLPTGSLMDSIGYQVFDAGILEFGQTAYETGYEFPGQYKTVMFRPGKIFVSETVGRDPLSVKDYGEILDDPDSETHRSWFKEPMEEIRPAMKKLLHKLLRESINKATRRYSVRKAVVFRIHFKKVIL